MSFVYHEINHLDNGTIASAYANDFSWAAHWHEEIEIGYVSKGALEVTANSHALKLPQGSLFFLPPNTIHSYQHDESNSIYLLIFSPKMFRFSIGETIAAYHFHPSEQEKIESLCTQIHQKDYANHSLLYNISSLLQILIIMLDHGPDQILTPDEGDDPLFSQQILNYLEAHFRSPLKIEQLSRHFGMSPRSLSDLFKKRFGVTIKQHLIYLRIQTACIELADTNLPILDICYGLGYQNLRSFNRNFADIMHMSPREYRKRNSP